MKYRDIVNGPQHVPAIILGCMRMPSLSKADAAAMIRSAVELGVHFFDHATCYSDGKAEERFGESFAETGIAREDVILQSKCGLCFDRNVFDWSKETIL